MSASKKRNQSVELSSGFSKEKGRRVEDGVNKSHRQRFLSAAATAGPSIPPPSWLRREMGEITRREREALARGFSADGVLRRRSRPLPARHRRLRPRRPPRKGAARPRGKARSRRPSETGCRLYPPPERIASLAGVTPGRRGSRSAGAGAAASKGRRRP